MILSNHIGKNPRGERQAMREYFDGFEYNTAGYTYVSNYIWRTTYNLMWEIIDDYLFIGSQYEENGKTNFVVAMPLTRDGGYNTDKLKNAIGEVCKRCSMIGVEFRIILIPKHMLTFLEEAFGDDLVITHERDEDEYVYLKEKLINLPGRALHRKKNHLNFFLRNYKYEARKISPDMADDIIKLVMDTHGDEVYYGDVNDNLGDAEQSLYKELKAIEEIVKLSDEKNIYSTAIYISDELKAFAIGEKLTDDTVVEHFEKASDEYRGLYQLVCREFCLNLDEDVKFVNREEDMGLQNLRAAKEALKPNHMVEKYSAHFKRVNIS